MERIDGIFVFVFVLKFWVTSSSHSKSLFLSWISNLGFKSSSWCSSLTCNLFYFEFQAFFFFFKSFCLDCLCLTHTAFRTIFPIFKLEFTVDCCFFFFALWFITINCFLYFSFASDKSKCGFQITLYARIWRYLKIEVVFCRIQKIYNLWKFIFLVLLV